MANTTVETGAVPAPKNLLARFVGIITSPRATYESVVAQPRWLGMLVLTTLIMAVCTTLPMTTDAGREAALDQQVKQMESFGITVERRRCTRGCRSGSAITPYITAASIIVMSPIMAVIFVRHPVRDLQRRDGGHGDLQAGLHASGCTPRRSARSASCSPGPFNYFRGAMTSATNLAVLLPMLPDTSFVGKLAGMIDLFVIWWVVVLSMGLAVLYRRKTQSIAITLFSIYAVIALAVAAFMSRGGTH